MRSFPAGFVSQLDVSKTRRGWKTPKVMNTDSETLTACQNGGSVWGTFHATTVADAIRRLVSVFNSEDHEFRYAQILYGLNVIICQKLVPSVDGRRVALRETLIMDEACREELITVQFESLKSVVSTMLEQRQSNFVADAQRQYDNGVISKQTLHEVQRTYR